jgi:hypothetical protein
MEKERLQIQSESMAISILIFEAFCSLDLRQMESGQHRRIFKVQQAQLEQTEMMEKMEVMERMAQMEKQFQMHLQQQPQ